VDTTIPHTKVKVFFLFMYHSRFIPEGAAEASRHSSDTPTFYQIDLAMRNTADVIGGKPIAI
jgi:hypothetical protein